MEVNPDPRARFAAIADSAADLRKETAAATADLPPELTVAATSVAYYLRQAELMAAAIAGLAPGSR
jgi:ABC-type Zn uptake system ZnuABC Zn-binding protein ZnuA